ncbi:hypothetical protein [Rubrivirga sp.]|uniref:hypothetical protein n=1 Tax=Rubrivirga sp. TaxID=1885344 RepID=UPI003C72F332
MPDVVSRSPDGRYTVEADAVPMRMSHEILPPAVRDLDRDRVIADLRGTVWSVVKTVWTEGHVTLTLQKYPNGVGSLTTTIDLEAETATVRGETVPAADLERALDAATVHPYDRPLADLLRRTLVALKDGPDAFAIEAEIARIRRDLEAGRSRLSDVQALFLPTGELQDVAIDQGWGDRFLALASEADRLSHPPRPMSPAPRAPAPRPPRVTVARLAPVLLLIGAALAGGLRGLLGMALVLLAIALLVVTPFLWFIGRPGASLFSSSGLSLRQQIGGAPVAFVVLVLVVVALEVGILAAAFAMFSRA